MRASTNQRELSEKLLPGGANPSMTQNAASGPGKRRIVTVGGRRVRTIDTWNHINGPNFSFIDVLKVVPKSQKLPPALETEAQKYTDKPIPDFDPRGPEVLRRLADMDAMGIDMAVVTPGASYWADREAAHAINMVNNEKLSMMCSAWPDRFAAFGVLSAQFPDLAVQEIEESMKLPGMKGFSLGGFINGTPLSDPKFHPLLAKAEELGAVLYVRGGSGETPTRLKGHGMLFDVVWGALGQTMCLTKLIQEGTLDLFPNLKVLAQRGGGYIINDDAFADRAHPFFPDTCLTPVKKYPLEYYLKKIYYDSVHQTPEGLRHLIAVVGVSQVLLGTDNQGQTSSAAEFITTNGTGYDPATGNRTFGVPEAGSSGWNPEAVDRILKVPGLNDVGKIAILGGNASKLLGLTS